MIKSYIGYSTDSNIRYKATSGGIGTSVLKYLFDKKIIETSITFDYDNTTLEYKPRLIYSFEDYKITGSIYHEIKLIQFIKEHISEIRGGFACFVLPCQAKAIRSILSRNNISSFLIGLTCSSQQNIDATYYLLKCICINKEDVQHIQYRGNGWPSGIQIFLKDGSTKFIPNNNSIWTMIFHSRIFIQKRCFSCQDTLNINSDISLADPWLAEFMKNEKIGQTLVSVNNIQADYILRQMQQLDCIVLNEINETQLLISQNNTILRKKAYKIFKNRIKIIQRIFLSKLYRKIATHKYLFSIHCYIKTKIEYFLIKKNSKK